jgi:Mn-dependent DtxR family transcriptional regulator
MHVLERKELARIERDGNSRHVRLTDTGRALAERLRRRRPP